MQSSRCTVAPCPRLGETVAILPGPVELAEPVFNVHVGDFAFLQHFPQHALALLGSSSQGGNLGVALGEVACELLDQGDGARVAQSILYAFIGSKVQVAWDVCRLRGGVVEEGGSVLG